MPRLAVALLLAVSEAAALNAATAASTASSTCFRKIAYPNGLSICISDGSTALRDMIGVRACLSPEEVDLILSEVRRADFPWTVARHKNYPTTDIETAAIPWIDELLQPHLCHTLLPTMAEVFQVDAAQLILRDTFIIKYAAPDASTFGGSVVPTGTAAAAAAAAGASPAEAQQQSSLDAHWDESCFSFVMQLNPLDEFRGGGTKFKHASEPLSVEPGEAMVFCGYNVHEGVHITSGERYLLTGFVDLRAPPSVLERFTKGQPILADDGTNHRFCFTDFASPHLPYNIAMLKERYECTESSGQALLRAIAYAPSPVPYLDLGPLARQCDEWLTRGVCNDEKFYRFLSLVIGQDA